MSNPELMRRQIASILFLLFTFSVHAQNLTISTIQIEGNRVTKENVILREIPFSVGDSVAAEGLKELKELGVKNLNNSSLFNFVDIKDQINEEEVKLTVIVDERWYIWPGIVFSLAETNLNSWLENKDFDRVNYGLYVQHRNFRGRKEKLTLNFQNGWKRKIGLNYLIPGLNKKRTIGAGIDFFYANNREINYASSLNKREFFKNDRFIQEEVSALAKVEFRPRYYNMHRVATGMKTVLVDDTVDVYTNEYLPNGRKRSQALLLNYGFRREKRDNVAYPLKGYLVDGTIEQVGFGLINNNDVQLTHLMATINTHHQLSDRWFFGHGIKGKTTLLGTPSYYYQRGLGYGSVFIRGYELDVIDGQHYALYKSNVKFQLIKKQVTDLEVMMVDRFDKFHYSIFLNLFGDAGYVVDNINASINPLANELQYGYGLGLDFVSYYDIVIRLEGSINRQGIPAFYIHFKNPI